MNDDTFYKIWITVCVIIFMSGMFFSIFTKRENVSYSENIDCDKLKDCMILDISCYNTTYKNNFFGLKWDVTNGLRGDNAKEYYKENCMEAQT